MHSFPDSTRSVVYVHPKRARYGQEVKNYLEAPDLVCMHWGVSGPQISVTSCTSADFPDCGGEADQVASWNPR